MSWLPLIRSAIAAVLWAAPVFLQVVVNRRLPAIPSRRAWKLGLALVAVGILAGGAGVWFARDLDPADVSVLGDSGIVEADVERVVDTLTEWGRGNYRTKVHPLQCLLFQPIAAAMTRLTGFSPLRATQLTVVMTQALALCLLAMTLWEQTRCWRTTALSTLLALSSFSFIFHSMVPESAGLASVTVVFPYYLFAKFEKYRLLPKERLLHIIGAVFALGVTTTNVVHSGIAYWWRTRDLRAAPRASGFPPVLSFAIHVAVAAAILSLLQMRLYPGSNPWFVPSSVREEASYLRRDMLRPAHWANTALQMFGYTMAAPRFVLTDRLVTAGRLYPQISAETADPTDFPSLTLLLIIGTLGLIAYSFISARRTSLGTIVALGLLSNLLLHLVYGSEYLLYSGNWTFLICLLIGLAVADRPKLQLTTLILLVLLVANNLGAQRQLTSLIAANGLQGSSHMPVGIPGSHEKARVFVDHIGGVSPGIGSYGIHVALWDPHSKTSGLANLIVNKAGGTSLLEGWIPVPVTETEAGDIVMRQSVAVAPTGEAVISVSLESSRAAGPTPTTVYVAVSRAGPASSRSPRACRWDSAAQAVIVDHARFLLCASPPTHVFEGTSGSSWSAILSGAPEPSRMVTLRYDLEIPAGEVAELKFIAPAGSVRSGVQEKRRAPASLPSAPRTPFPAIYAEDRHQEAVRYWRNRFDSLRMSTPDPTWREVFLASSAQLSMLVEEGGRPVVSPVNYDVFVRDGVYAVNALLVSGQTAVAKEAIEYLVRHPWAGRPYVEGDSPGQLLWILGRYWAFTHDEIWLAGKVEIVSELARVLAEMRTYGSPVSVELLGQVRVVEPDSASPKLRRCFPATRLPLINYGGMDGGGVLYVNLFSIAGLRAATVLLTAAGEEAAAEKASGWREEYEREFVKLTGALAGDWKWDGRGHCAVLWPCGYHLDEAAAGSFFSAIARDWSESESLWPYLDMDAAHNAMLAGHRAAGYRTLERYFRMQSVRTFRTLDEGGPSSSGYWSEISSNPPWPSNRAMPHSWSTASMLSLLRDCLVAEDDSTCTLLAGVPEEWFSPGNSITYTLPTLHGELDLSVDAHADRVEVVVRGHCRPPNGFILILPEGFDTGRFEFPWSTKDRTVHTIRRIAHSS